MLYLKYKTFRAGPKYGFFWTEQILHGSRDRLREQAMSFAATVGAENIVSVTEEMIHDVLIVTLWYREEGLALPCKIATDDL